MIEFRILGPLEAEREGEAVALGGQKQRALLAALLVRAGETVSTDRLVDELWGAEPPRTATTSLQNFVSQLRKLLGPDILVTKPPGYVLRLEADTLDAVRFERLVREARAGSAEKRAAALRHALTLWRGTPLAEFAFDSFAQSEIRRLEELRLSALEDRIDAELELGQTGELVGELESLVAEQPLRERLRAQLMLALYRSGRQAEALDAYQSSRRALVDELGIDPGPALQRLHASILRQERALEPTAPPAPVADHLADVARALVDGRLVAVLGFGVNVAGRNAGGNGGAASTFAPDERDVASYLVECFDCPPEHDTLGRVAQYVALKKGLGPLYDELHAVFDRDYPPGPVHRFLAGLPALLRERGAPHPLLVTTHYDETLERALADAGEAFDVVSYIAAGRDRGKFLHIDADGSARVVDVANSYRDLSLDARTVILKINGRVDRGAERDHESFVVSEDDYIGYLAQGGIATVVPVMLAAKLRRSHFLFLGYALHEWHLRVFLHRVWDDRQVAYRSWAIQPRPHPIEHELWRQRGVDIYDVPLDEYVGELGRRLAEMA
jgi:DNA-binding SARP family transcriptional activator